MIKNFWPIILLSPKLLLIFQKISHQYFCSVLYFYYLLREFPTHSFIQILSYIQNFRVNGWPYNTMSVCEVSEWMNSLLHGLRTPNEAFFHRNPKFLANLSAPILVLWVPCPCFPLIIHYFYKKLSLYIQIPNIYLGLGFELGPQRIGDLAIVCP